MRVRFTVIACRVSHTRAGWAGIRQRDGIRSRPSCGSVFRRRPRRESTGLRSCRRSSASWRPRGSTSSCRAARVRTPCCPTTPSPPPARRSSAHPSILDAADVWGADVVVKIAPPDPEEIRGLGSGSILIGFLAPLTSPQTTRALADAGATAFAMEAIPRISRAQAMDALSSQSNVAGYRAALLGAEQMGRFYPMLMTAAGTIPPAKVLVLGVGVAGLQALATAKRLGARTTGYDVRPEVAEQVQSLGAQWLDLGLEASGEGGYARELTEEERAAPAAGADRRDQGLRRGHHDRARPGAPRAQAGHGRGRRGDEGGLGDRRHGRRGGRQLRADRARRDGRPSRREDRLAAEPAGEDARALLAAVRAQRAGAARAVRRRGRQPAAGLRR